MVLELVQKSISKIGSVKFDTFCLHNSDSDSDNFYRFGLTLIVYELNSCQPTLHVSINEFSVDLNMEINTIFQIIEFKLISDNKIKIIIK